MPNSATSAPSGTRSTACDSRTPLVSRRISPCFGARRRSHRRDRRPPPRSDAAAGPTGPDRGPRAGDGPAGPRVAPCDVAQRRQSPLGRALRGPPRHARARLAAAPPRPRSLALCERASAHGPRRHYLFVHLPAAASLTQLVRLAHQRWAIEQQYQDLKTELGLDHFEGRSYPGWQHHVVLSAVAYAFLQRERMRPGATARRSRFRSAGHRARDLHRAAVYQSASLHAVDEPSGSRFRQLRI